MDNQQNNQQPNVQPQQTEEMEKRTYKGLVFNSEEDKNRIVEFEQHMTEYCDNLEGKSYKELFEKNMELGQWPNTIFMPFSVKIMSVIGAVERKEVDEYKERISGLSLEQLEEIKTEIPTNHYTEAALVQLNNAIIQRKRECETKILEDMLIGFESLSREQLKELKQRVSEKNYEMSITNPILTKIDAQSDVVEQNELQSICENVENMQMNELEGAMKVIEAGNYQQKFSAQYISMINNRIEQLQLMELEEMTAKKDDLSKAELEALYAQLEQGGYNPKFVKRFMLDIRKRIENKRYLEVLELTKDVFDKNKNEVLKLENAVDNTGYSQGILVLPRKKIADKKFEFDMLELMEMCNDFDSLSDEEVDKLINEVKEKGLGQKSTSIYLDRLNQRKLNIALSNVCKLATYFVQVANKYGVGGGDILVASKSDAFLGAYRALKNAYPTSGEYDIPAFIMNGSVSIAMSYKYCYLNHGSKQALVEITNINGFKTVKKFLMESLVLELKDGSTIPVSGSINKQYLAGFLQMMNEFVANVNNSMIIDSFVMPTFNVASLDKDSYIAKNNEYSLKKEELKRITISEMCVNPSASEAVKAMHNENSKDWDAYQSKVKTNYPVELMENVVFVYDKTLLNSAKEGFALTENKIYIKKSGQPVIAIDYNDVFVIKVDAAGKICVETTGLAVIMLDMVNVTASCAIYMAEKMNEYIKNMQLYSMIEK